MLTGSTSGPFSLFLCQNAPAPRGFCEAAPDRRLPAGKRLACTFGRFVAIVLQLLLLCCLHVIRALKAISPTSLVTFNAIARAMVPEAV